MSIELDQIDRNILNALQRCATLSQRALAEQVGLSQNACWRRLRALEDAGVIRGRTILLDRDKVGAGLVTFVFVRTSTHSTDWLAQFRRHVRTIPEVVDFYRISGEYDYMLKVVTADIAGFDQVYKRLIDGVAMETVTSFFAMETIEEQRPLQL
ncbi:Lrp/AsnC family transcriptional regulator [Sagittula sp. SSi028]|uniref:Lrp/AsnC family transcriptional regulator n=1 Tax=Sagittula sp. SSi028 TaxID=3400636 RepID=UPI003AF8912E